MAKGGLERRMGEDERSTASRAEVGLAWKALFYDRTAPLSVCACMLVPSTRMVDGSSRQTTGMVSDGPYSLA
jgi:hypothetical protein